MKKGELIPSLNADEATSQLSEFKNLVENYSLSEKEALDTGNFKNYFRSFITSTTEAERTTQNYLKHIEKYRDAQIKNGEVIEKVGLKTKLASAGMNALSMAGNMLTGMAVAAGIQLIVTGLDNIINRSEKIIEAGNKARDAIATIGDAYNSKLNTVSDNRDKFIQLSQGVNNRTNENLSLTTDEYSDFLSIANQLAETFPSLVTGYDAQGNALLSLSGNADETSASLEKLLEQERQLADFKISQNLQTAFNGVVEQNNVLLEQIDTLEQSIDLYNNLGNAISDLNDSVSLSDLGFTTTEDTAFIKQFAEFGDQNAVEALNLMRQAFVKAANDAGLVEGLNYSILDNFEAYQGDKTGQEWTASLYGASKKQLDTFKNSYKAYIQETGNDIADLATDAMMMKNQDVKEIQANWQSLIPTMISAMSVYDGYNKLGDDIKQAINTGIGNIDPVKEWMGEDGKITSPDNIRAYLRQKFLDPITSVLEDETLSLDQKQSFQNAIDGMFSLDKTSLSVSDYQTQLSSYLDSIRGFFKDDETFNDFVLSFGFKVQTDDGTVIDSSESLLNDIKEKIGQDGSSNVNLDELTYEQLVNVHTTVTDPTYGGTVADAIKEELNKTKQTVDTIEPITFSSLFTSDEEGSLNKTVDKFQSNIDSIDSALTSLKNGEKVDLTDLTQQFPELAGQTDNLEESLNNLKANKLSEFALQWKEFIADLDPSQMKLANSFIQDLIGSIDFYGLDLTDAKTKFISALIPNPTDLDSTQRKSIIDTVNGWFDNAKPKFTTLKDIFDDDQASSTIDKYKSKITSLRDSLDTLKSGSMDKTAITDLLEQFPELANETDDLQSGIEDLIDSLNADTGSFFDDIIERMKLEGAEQSAIEAAEKYKKALMDSLNNIDESIWASPLMDAIDKAGQTKNAGSDYENAVSKLKTAKELFDSGLTGTDDFKSIAKYISPTGASDPMNFAENYAKAKRYLTDGDKGVKNFLKDLSTKTDDAGNALASFNDKTKEWTYNIKDAESAAQSMGIGFEFFMDMFGRLEDYGAHNNFFSSVTEGEQHITDLTHKLAQAQRELAQLEAQGANSSAIEAKKAEVDSYISDLQASNQLIDDIASNTAERESQKMQNAIDTIESLAKTRDKALADNTLQEYTEGYVEDLNRQIQDIAKESGIELDANLNVTDESKEKAKAEIKKLYGDGTIENPLKRDFGNGRDVLDTIQKYDSITQKIQEQTAAGNEELAKSFETLKNYSQSQLSGINLFDGKYDSSELQDAEKALDNIMTTLGISKDEASQLINVLADMGLIKLDIDTSSLETADINSVIENLSEEQTISFKAELDDGSLAEIEAQKDEQGQITYTANVNGVQYAIDTVTQNEDGTITYTANIDGVETELTSVQNADGTITYTINTQGGTPESVPDANGTANFGLGESPDEVPDSQGTANFDLGEYPKTVPDATGTVNFDLGTYPTVLPPATQYVNRILMGGDTGKDGDASGTLLSYAHKDGTAYNVLNMRSAYADGKVALEHDEQAVVNELGTEGIIRNGRLFAIPGGMHLENLRKGDIILSAQQMKMLFSGKDAGHARAYAEGTAPFSHFIAQSYASGTPAGTGGITFSGGSSYTGNPLSKPQSDNTKATQDNTNKTKENTEATKESTEAFDWVKTKLDKFAKAVETIGNKITDYISIPLKNLYLKRQINALSKEISANRTAYDTYMKQAESIDISDNYKKLVQNGDFKIEEIDTSTDEGKQLAENIKKYEEYYNKCLDCSDAIQELNNKHIELYETLVNLPIEQTEKKIEKLENRLKSLTSFMSTISSGGSAINALKNIVDADNPDIQKIQDAYKTTKATVESTQKTRVTTARAYKTAKADYMESGTTLSQAVQKQTDSAAKTLKKATKNSTSKTTYTAIVNAIKNKQPVSLKGLKGTDLEAAKKYNNSLKQEQYVVGHVAGRQNVSTAGLSKDIKALAKEWNADNKAMQSATKEYEKAVDANEKAKDAFAKAQTDKKSLDRSTTSEQRSLANLDTTKKSYVLQNKWLDEEIKVLKDQNKQYLSAVKQTTKTADKELANRDKKQKEFLNNKKFIKALTDDQLKALKNGEQMDLDGLVGDNVKIGEQWNKTVQKTTLALEAQTTAVQNLTESEATLAEKLVENEKKKLENISNYYDSMMAQFETKNSLIQTYMNRMETRGYNLSTSFYEAQIANQKQIANKQKAELEAMQKSFQEAIENGIEPGTQEYNEMKDTIDQLTLSIAETTNNIVELQASIRDLEWEQFDRLQESIKRVASESDFLIELMSSKDLYDKKTGLLTDEGWATMGLHGVNYNTYMAQADKYKEEMLKISAELASDPNNQKLIDRKNELIDAQQQSILAAENEKKSIRDMVENGIDMELDAIDDLIDKYLDAIEAKRSLWEYEKKIQKQAESIASLQKQLAAYQNDNSEEARAKIQEIKVNLKEAQDNLKEAEYDKFISDQKELLESLRNDYEEVLNKRLDNIDVLIQTSIDQINTNAENIQATLTTQAKNVGYELSTEMKTIWTRTDGVTGAISTYDGHFTSTMTGVSTALGNIYKRQENMINAINNMAEKYIQKVDEITKSPVISSLEEGTEKVKVDEVDANNKNTIGGTTTGKFDKNDLKNTSGSGATLSGGSSSSSSGSSNKNNATSDNSNIWKGIAKDNSMKGDKSLDINTSIYDRIAYNGYKTGFASQKQLYSNLKGSGTYTGTAEQNTWMIKQLKLKGYASGGHVDKDQWAVMNENGQELIRYNGGFLVPLPESADIWNSPETKALLNNMSNPQPLFTDYTSQFMKSLQSVGGNGGGQNVEYRFDNVTLNLPNVKNYPEFMNAMVKDKKFERLINAMTIDKIHGGTKLSKHKISWTE